MISRAARATVFETTIRLIEPAGVKLLRVEFLPFNPSIRTASLAHYLNVGDDEVSSRIHGTVTIHREGRSAELPLVGSRQELDLNSVRKVCEALGLKWSDLPGPKGRV